MQWEKAGWSIGQGCLITCKVTFCTTMPMHFLREFPSENWYCFKILHSLCMCVTVTRTPLLKFLDPPLCAVTRSLASYLNMFLCIAISRSLDGVSSIMCGRWSCKVRRVVSSQSGTWSPQCVESGLCWVQKFACPKSAEHALRKVWSFKVQSMLSGKCRWWLRKVRKVVSEECGTRQNLPSLFVHKEQSMVLQSCLRNMSI